MYRTVYTFDNKDFEERDAVSLSFYLPRNSIEAFLELCCKNLCGYRVKNSFQSDGTKLVTVTTMAFKMAGLFQSLGFRSHHTVLNSVNVTHSFLRRERFNYQKLSYLCYDPQTHTTVLRGNSPFVIKGKQQIFNGKLWRRYDN